MFTLAVTDLRWHGQHLLEPHSGAVCYWTPTPWNVRLRPGTRWGFMLKSPVRRIGGFGTFVRYSNGRLSEGWDRYGPGNGASSFEELRSWVLGYSSKRSTVEADEDDPIVGLIELDGCVFLGSEDQIDPADLGLAFPNPIVKFKRFDGELRLPTFPEVAMHSAAFVPVPDDGTEWEWRKAKKRQAQGLFRKDVLEAYGKRCAISGFTGTEALDAAHIQPFVNLASNHVQNGLALRKDLHCLFDAGLLTVDSSHRLMISPKLAGTSYATLDGQRLKLPSRREHWPSHDALAIHRASFRST